MPDTDPPIIEADIQLPKEDGNPPEWLRKCHIEHREMIEHDLACWLRSTFSNIPREHLRLARDVIPMVNRHLEKSIQAQGWSSPPFSLDVAGKLLPLDSANKTTIASTLCEQHRGNSFWEILHAIIFWKIQQAARRTAACSQVDMMGFWTRPR